MRFSDQSGWVRAAVCCAALLAHHALRDALITALPTLAASDSPTTSTVTPATSTFFAASTQGQEAHVEYVNAATTTDTTLNATQLTNITFRNRKLEKTVQGRDSFNVANTIPLSRSVAGRETLSSDAAITVDSLGSGESREKVQSEGSDRFETKRLPLENIPPLKQEAETANYEVNDDMLKRNTKGDSVIYARVLSRQPLFAFRGGKDTSVPVENVQDRTHTRGRQGNRLDSSKAHLHRTKYKVVLEGKSVSYKHKHDISGRVKLRNSKVILGASSPPAQWRRVQDRLSRQGGDLGREEAHSEEKIQPFSVEGHQLKEEWSLVVEGVVLSSVYWGWLFAALLADLLIDRAGARVVLAVSVCGAGLLGLLTHAASLGGPWALLGLRVVQGAIQGLSYPAVVRVLEGIPSAARAPAALVVFLGPCLGTGLGAGLGSLPQWYVATYVVGCLAVVLTPLCLLLPSSPPDATTHKEMPWKGVLSCRGVWACVGVHVANTWMLYTLLVGLPFCLTYTVLEQPSASGWVVAAAAVVVCVVVRLQLFLAWKLPGKRLTSVLNRRRILVVTGTVMVTASVIVMAIVGLDSMEVLVGVGVGLAGVGVGVARVGYRLNVDDMAPSGAWRVTKVLDAAAVVTAALSPLVVSALAQVGTKGWVGVWLVPLAALLPAAVIHLFLLTCNPQPWDQTEKSSGVGTNGAAGGGDAPVNGAPSTLSVGRQSFKSARSALTFKTARSRSRTRTLSCRTVDDDLEGDMYSVANSNVDYCSVADERDRECVSVASSSTFKSDGADMHSVVEGVDGAATPGKQSGHKFGSMLVNGGTADRTSAWLSSHHDLVLEAGGDHASPTRADAHATNAIYGLVW